MCVNENKAIEPTRVTDNPTSIAGFYLLENKAAVTICIACDKIYNKICISILNFIAISPCV